MAADGAGSSALLQNKLISFIVLQEKYKYIHTCILDMHTHTHAHTRTLSQCLIPCS